MEVNEYAMMWKNRRLGTFFEIYDRKRSFQIEFPDNILQELRSDEVKLGHPFLKLRLRLNSEGYIDDEGVRLFISFRVMPKNRINCDEVLRELGLSEYDQYSIFKKNNGACLKDDLWVNFDDVSYDEFHPRARLFK